jgi:hypothetical protein
MKYICMKCGKIYEDKYIPSYDNRGDGCCTIGSLIEVEQEEENVYKIIPKKDESDYRHTN